MSHKIYRNLAHLDDIGTDLNYTGIVLDNWDHPVNLIPVAMVILYLIMGIPRSLLGLWVLINGCVIHPWMDGYVMVFTSIACMYVYMYMHKMPFYTMLWCNPRDLWEELVH